MFLVLATTALLAVYVSAVEVTATRPHDPTCGGKSGGPQDNPVASKGSYE